MATTAIGSDRNTGPAFERYFDAVFMRDDKTFYFGTQGSVGLTYVSATGQLTFSGAVGFSVGTAAVPVALATATNQATFYTTNSNAGGTSRGIYWRHYMTGAGASGETGRFFSTFLGTGGVGIHGVHASLAFDSSAVAGGPGTLTGEGAALRATLQVPAAVLGGTASSLIAELDAEGTTSNLSNGSFLRCVISGDPTGAGLLNASAKIFQLDGITIGSAGTGNVVDAISGDKAVTHLGKIALNGVLYYIMLRNAV
jgi:hypothetical protein